MLQGLLVKTILWFKQRTEVGMVRRFVYQKAISVVLFFSSFVFWLCSDFAAHQLVSFSGSFMLSFSPFLFLSEKIIIIMTN